MPTSLPERFTINGRYEISERLLGEDSMGVTYKAYDIVTKRFVALKTIWAGATPATLKLFEREWAVLARLSHPNIVDILDTGDWVFDGERYPYFVIPLLSGRTLEDIIQTSPGGVPVERAVDIVSQACRGLEAAHDQNVIHRDIKPRNILVMEDDTVKIMDFGVVQPTEGTSPDESVKGTPWYMAPELWQMKPATPLSDIFSLATVCYETLTGRQPFAHETSTETGEAIRAYIPPAASEINPAVNQLVSRTVHKAMAKQPWQRFQSAREFGDTLQKALRNEPIERFARHGLQDILKIDSSNTEAHEMLASIDQTEEEIVKTREEKERLYESAADSYSQGEADAAGHAYQEGRDHLAAGNIAQALAVCDEYLAKNPGDTMFQALKLEGQMVQRDERSTAIADVSQRVEDGRDLEQKYKILQDAVEHYPDEPHFRSALKLIADRRELVSGILKRARQCEERGQIGDALGQIEILGNIYPLFPGLESETQRLIQRQEEQAKLDEKARWIERIESHLHAAEYDQALATVPEALAAFPGDKDLLQCQSLAEKGVARNNEANILLKQGQELCAAGSFPEGLDALRKAERLDPRNRSARAALMSGLAAYARELMPSDWRAAEPIVKEALDLDPTDPVARSLLAVLDDNRRQTAINIILAGARNYQTDGHLSDALQIVERGLVQYPNDQRLTQLSSTLRAQISQPLAPQRHSRVIPPSPAAQPETQPTPLPPPSTIRQNLFSPPLTELPREKQSAGSSEDKIAPSADENPSNYLVRRPPPFRPPPPSHAPFTGPIWAVAFLVAIVVILGAGLYAFLHKPEKPSWVTSAGSPDARMKRSVNPQMAVAANLRFPVTLESSVADTHFSEDGQSLKSAAQLSAGIHNIDAFHEGYLPENKTVTVDPTATPFTVTFDLRPILPLLRLSSSISSGRLVIDGSESLNLQSGVAGKEDIPLGPHTVKIYDGQREVFSFVFNAQANEMPLLAAPLGTQPIGGAVVASLSGSARVYATPGLRASAKPPVAAVPADGLLLNGTTSAPARFLLDAGKGRAPLEQSVDPSAFPTLNIQLAGSSRSPSVTITSNAPNCQMTVDGKLLGRPMEGGSASLPLDPGTHPIRLSCPGYDELEKSVFVKPNDPTPQKLDFAMLPVAVAAAPVLRAVLTLTGAPPEALVFQNQTRVGAVASDGTFSKEIDPGAFTFEWRKAGFEPRKATRTVKAGDSIRLDGAMTPSLAAVTLKVSPEEAHISLRRDSDNSLTNVPNNQSISLPPGSYHAGAEAPGYRGRTEPVALATGKPLSLSWDLEKLPTLSAPARFFEDGDSWKPLPDAPEWWVHPGSGYSTLRSSTGAFSIDFLRRKGLRHKTSLLADCEDHANCIIYSLDAHNLTTKVVSGGATLLDEKKPHGVDNNSSIQLLFEMSPDGIVVKNEVGTVLSSVERQNPRGKLAIQDETPLKIN